MVDFFPLCFDGAVNAIDGKIVRAIIPRIFLYNGIPLFFGAVIMDFFQIPAIIECLFINVGDAVRDGYTNQTTATTEQIIADTGNIVAKGHIGQVRATIEYPTVNGSDRLRNRIISGNFFMRTNQKGLILVEKHTVIVTCIIWIVVIHPNTGQIIYIAFKKIIRSST